MIHYLHESKPQSSSQNVRNRQQLSSLSPLLVRAHKKLICKTGSLKPATLICKGRTRRQCHSGYCNEMKISRIHPYTSKGTWMHNTNTDASKDMQFWEFWDILRFFTFSKNRLIHSHHTVSKLLTCFSTALSDTTKAKGNHTDSVDFVQIERILRNQKQCKQNCVTVF